MTKASGKLEEYLSIAQQIAEQQKLEGEVKQRVAPVNTPIVAKAHTPVYNLHHNYTLVAQDSGLFTLLIRWSQVRDLHGLPQSWTIN